MRAAALGTALGVAGLAPVEAQVDPAFSGGFYDNGSALGNIGLQIPNIGGITSWTLPGSDQPIKFSGYTTQCPFSASSCFYNYAWTSVAGPAAGATGASYGG
jgi:hypothetical protein